MHCPQCGKNFTAVQTVCPSCYVELVKDAPRVAPLGARLEFGKPSSSPAPPPRPKAEAPAPPPRAPAAAPAAAKAKSVPPPPPSRKMVRPDIPPPPPAVSRDLPPTTKQPASAVSETAAPPVPAPPKLAPEPEPTRPAQREDDIPTGKLNGTPPRREDDIPTGKLPQPEPARREDDIPTGELPQPEPARREDDIPTGKLPQPEPARREDDIPTGKLPQPEPARREDDIPTGQLAPQAEEQPAPVEGAPAHHRTEAERTAAVAAALMRNHYHPQPEPAVEEPVVKAVKAEATMIDCWNTENAAPASPQRQPGKTEWILAALLLPGLLLMWFLVVQPLMKSAQAPPPPVRASEPIAIPSGVSPEDTFKGAQARYARKDYRGAASEARLALTVWESQKADPRLIKEARYLIANAYAKAGEYEQSLAVYRQMLKSEPQDVVLLSESKAVHAQMQKAGRVKANATFEQARQQFAGGDYTRAVATARTALMTGKQFGSDKTFQARCSSLIGRGYLKQGRYNEAVAALGQAVALNPSDSQARQSLREAKRQIALQEEALRSQYSSYPTYQPRDEVTPGSTPRRNGSTGYPRANVRRDENDNRRLPKPQRPTGNYNPDYSVPGTKYTPRESGLPDLPASGTDDGGLPTYGDNRNQNLPSYNSGSNSNTLPTYSNQGGGVYPGYQSGNKNSGAPPGY